MFPHGLDKSLSDAYVNVRGRLPGVVNLPDAAINSWEWQRRVCIPDEYLPDRGSSYWAQVRWLYYEAVSKRTKCLNEGNVDCGAIHGDATADFDLSTWFTRTSGERELTRDLAQLLAHPPTDVQAYVVNRTVLQLDLFVPRSFRFLSHGRREGGRIREHAVCNNH